MSQADADADGTRTIHVGETADGDPVELPVVEVLTGRGFITGKSGSGKSNTASVVVEELLEAGYPVCIIDTDGEYYGLKQSYELLHAGADEECDVQVSSEHAEKLANLALEENVPLILDVSGFLDKSDADELIRETARHLFAKEKKLKKPFLLVVEECHEYIPESGGMDETGRMFVQIGKRGRKHGLGIVGISQRPADVKKDFITQANWLTWHRLTWENDTKVVGRIVGSEYGNRVSDLNDGQAFVQSDWTEADVQTIQFKRKRTFDAGATPGLDDFERPELKSVSDTLTEDLAAVTELQEQRQDRIKDLERKLENREQRIAELERELDNARDVSAAARKMANALQHGSVGTGSEPQESSDTPDSEETVQAELPELRALKQRVEDLESTIDAIEELETVDPDGSEDATDDTRRETDADVEDVAEEARQVSDLVVDAFQERLKKRGEQLAAAELEAVTADDEPTADDGQHAGADTEAMGAFEPATPVDESADAGAGPDDAVIVDGTTGEPATASSGDAVSGDAVSGDEEAGGEGSGGEILDSDPDEPEFTLPPLPSDFERLLSAKPVLDRLAAAVRDSQCNREYGKRLLAAIAEEPRTVHELAAAAHVSTERATSLIEELRARELLVRDADRNYAFRTSQIRLLADEDPHEGGELGGQWRPS